MQKIINRLIFLSLLAYSFLLIPAPVEAQSVGLSISPPVVEILLSPTKKIIQTFTIKNQGESGQFIADFHLVKPNGTAGQVIVDPAPLDPSSIPLVLTLSGDGIRAHTPFPLSAGASQSLVVSLEGATTDLSQDTYFALLVTPVLESGPAGGSSTLPGIASLILVTLAPSGVLPVNLGIENFELPLLHDNLTPLFLTPTLKNGSDIMVRPEGKLAILSPRGNHDSEIKLFPHLVLGNSSRRLSASDGATPPAPIPLVFRPSWRSLGPYRLRLTITTLGGTQLQEVERTVWLLPLRAIFAFTLLSIAVGIVIIRQRKRTQT